MRPCLAADEFEGLRDGDDGVDARSDRKRFDFMAASTAADGGNDGALGSTRDMGLESGFADALNDVLDLLLGGAVRHVYDHGDKPFLFQS